MNIQRCAHHSGTALLTVLCLMFVLSAILAGIMTSTGSHSLIERKQEASERAFFIAEAGVERMAQYYGNGGTGTLDMSGTIDDGSFVGFGICGGTITDTWHSVTGLIDVNPNSSIANRMTLTLPDGSEIKQSALTTNYEGFIGSITYLMILPGGAGGQNSLNIDLSPYPLTNSSTYEIISAHMAVSLYNDSWAITGVSTGKWFISVAAAQASTMMNGSGSTNGSASQAQVQYSMISIGTVNNESRTVIRETLKQKTWAEYAMWMSRNNGVSYSTGERLYGKVHSNEKFSFIGSPEFFASVTSHATNFTGSTNAVIFHSTFTLGSATQSMQNISFSNLQTKATLVLTGQTTIAMSKTNMIISNSRKSWTNAVVGCNSNGLIYIKTATTGTASTQPADIFIGGTGTLNGRITLVCERDIYITNSILYADDAKTNLLSDDALGLIAKRDISIYAKSPTNLSIYAHMIASGLYDTNSTVDGCFSVTNLSSITPKGRLTIHGGIVQDYRGGVGQVSGTNLVHGYLKDYTYDVRFATNPPPDYPPLSDQLDFGLWREQ